VGGSARLYRVPEAARNGLRRELAPDPSRRLGVEEEHGSEGDGGRSGGDQLERVAAARDAAHADDRERHGAVAGPDGGERDRPERRA
jgi:hypothetical protein